MNFLALLVFTISTGLPLRVDSVRVSGNKAVLNAPIVNSISVYPQVDFYLKGDTIVLKTKDTTSQYLVVYKSFRVNTPVLFDTVGTSISSHGVKISENPSTVPTEQSLDLSGIKTVGIFGGTNRSTTLNQLLDLRIHGKFAGYRVEGIINDQNLSYQGTERLRNIDKVFLRVVGKRLFARIGDLEPQNIGQNLKLRGFAFGYNMNKMANLQFTYGIEDGTPITYEFHPQPGKLGPYFIDPEGQPVRIVPGSERVFLNGILLTRGKSGDYTVDELIGTITFTPKWTFTESDVVRVEYQKQATYPVTEYIEARSKLQNISVGIVQEGANTQLLKKVMSSEQVKYLESLGDTSGFVWVNGGKFVGLGNGNYELRDSVYEYVGENAGSYIVHFEYVGEGNGDYVYNPQLGAFKFVGKNLGDYRPIEKIEIPDKKRYLLLNLEEDLNKSIFLKLNIQGLHHFRNVFARSSPRRSVAGNGRVVFHPLENFSAGFFSYFKNKQFVFLNREGLPVGYSNLYGLQPYSNKNRVMVNEFETVWRPESGIMMRTVLGTAELGDEYRERVSGEFEAEKENAEFKSKIDRVSGDKTQMTRTSLSMAVFKNLDVYPVVSFWREQSDTSKNTIYGTGVESRRFKINLRYYPEKRLTVLSSIGNMNLWLIKFSHQAQISRKDSAPIDYAFNLNWRFKSFSGSHQVSNGSLAERQVTYRYVGPGQGDYSYDPEKGEYVPDPNGDFIRVNIYSGSYTTGRIQSHSLNYFGMIQKTSLGVSMNARFQGQNQSYYQSTLNLSRPGRFLPHLNLDFVYRLTSNWKEVLGDGGLSLVVVSAVPSVSTEFKIRYHESSQQFVLRKLEDIWKVTWQGRVVWQLVSEIGYALSGDMRAITIGTGPKARSQNLYGFYLDSYFRVRFTSVTGSIPSALGFLIEPGPSFNASVGLGKAVGATIELSSYLSWWYSAVRKDIFFNISASTRF